MSLLDDAASFLKTPEGIGTLSAIAGYAANARRGAPINSLGRGAMTGLLGYSNAQENQLQNEFRTMQIDDMKRKLALNKSLGEALKTGYAGSANVQSALEGGGGPTVENAMKLSSINGANPVGAPRSPAQMMADAARQTGDFDAYQKAQTLLLEEKKLAPKYATDVRIVNKNGMPTAIQMADDGTWKEMGSNITPAEKLAFQNLGNKTVGLDPFTGQQKISYAQGMSPEAAASNSLGWARFGFDKQQATKPTYHEGVWVTPPTAANPEGTSIKTPLYTPKQGTPDAMAASSKKLLPMLEEANTYIDKATGSYGGAVRDFAGSVVGKSTEGAKNVAKLKALEGHIMLSQPRMEGPQSDKDVALYRQMAAEIGDPTVPSDIKRSALDTVYRLHQRYSGAPETGLPTLGGDVRSAADAILSGRK